MLQALPQARERRQKDVYLVRLLTAFWSKKSFPNESALVDLIRDYTAADRAWRKILEENLGLRGQDYTDKKVYEQKTQIGLGYESGYNELSTNRFDTNSK